ncbi:hypothetical protein COJ90_21770 [Priestia megaterium]|uniref:hypothetical protein n=1 Tax=Priestia megaterium TaxID=1404 RepID=UPI000BF62B0D|nr:hypothetical protein [Priestia megaterium]PFP08564.1 hypothetical protein COJ90_21770 [Priestia megaterium]
MAIKIVDHSFRTNLKLNDVLVTREGKYYIVLENDIKEYPYRLVDIQTFKTKRNLSKLEKQVNYSGASLCIGQIEKIIDGSEFELCFFIKPRETSL